MSKKMWLGIGILAVILGYLGVSRAFPQVGQGIDSFVGPTLGGIATGIYTAVNTNPIWMQYDIYFALVAGMIIMFLLAWQGHNAYNYVRRGFVSSAAKEAGVPYVSSTGGRVSTPAGATTRPKVTPKPETEVPVLPPEETEPVSE